MVYDSDDIYEAILQNQVTWEVCCAGGANNVDCYVCIL